MIQSFADKETERVWSGQRSRKLTAQIQQRARGKLLLIDAAEDVEALRNPPSNDLHPLYRERLGQHAISINRQWRI